MTGLSVLVVDDEPLARRRLTRLLSKLDWVYKIDEAADVAEACHKANITLPDIMLLDIQMPGGSGFDVIAHLSSPAPIIIFVTAFDHHALRAFEANAIDYITKPIEHGRFDMAMKRARAATQFRHQAEQITELKESVTALKRALNLQHNHTNEFWVKVRGEHVRIALENIIRIQAERDYVRIHTLAADYLYLESLSSLERRLDSTDFIRIHRSTILRKSAILRIKKAPFAAFIVILADGSEARIGRTYTSAMKASFTQTHLHHW